MLRSLILNFPFHSTPVFTINLRIEFMDFGTVFAPITQIIKDTVVGEFREGVDEVGSWSAGGGETGDDAVYLFDILAVPYILANAGKSS